MSIVYILLSTMVEVKQQFMLIGIVVLRYFIRNDVYSALFSILFVKTSRKNIYAFVRQTGYMFQRTLLPLLKPTFEILMVFEKVCRYPSVLLVCSPQRAVMAFEVVLEPA